MVALQIINKCLSQGNLNLLDDNAIPDAALVGYEGEIAFIRDFYNRYGKTPDRETFASKFAEFEFLDVQESDRYLVDTVQEEYLYYQCVPVLQKAAELLKTDSRTASEYMVQALKELEVHYALDGTDIIAQASERLDKYKERQEKQDEWFFTTGFEELDDITHGIQRGEELFVIFARTNQGKSWVLEKMCTHVWELGFNVGYISPEMSADSIGYRFDTLHKNFSNKALMWGKGDLDEAVYEDYIEKLKERKNKFIVATPIDFDRKITVSKLRTFVKNNKLDLVAVDGITYMTDERFKKGDNKTTTLTNISEDLMMLSMELKVPVLIVVQANRQGKIDDDKNGTPDLESIRDSDGISHNASKVLAIRQLTGGVLEIGVKKQRFGRVGETLQYQWNPDVGDFNYLRVTDETPRTKERPRNTKRPFKDKEDVF